MRKLGSIGLIIPTVAVALLASACSSSSSATPSNSGATPTSGVPSSSSSSGGAGDPLLIKVGALNFDFTKYCPTKPTVVGILDGYGGNGWAVGKRAMLTSLAKSCPNVTDVKYVDAGGDPQKYIAGVNSLVAQGVNVIETFDLFGQAAVPAFTKAQQQGVLVGDANAVPGNGQVPADLTSVVVPDFDKEATIWVKFLTDATANKGKIAFVGGPAGNLFDTPALAAVQKAIAAQSSGIQLVTAQPLAGGWDPATTQQVMTGLLQKDPTVNGVILSYSATGPAIVRAYEAANLPLPAITGQSSSMELICLVHTKQAANPTLKVQSLDATANLDAIAMAKLFAIRSGNPALELGPNDAYTQVVYAEYINTMTGLLPACDPGVPPGADLSMALSRAALLAAFNK